MSSISNLMLYLTFELICSLCFILIEEYDPK